MKKFFLAAAAAACAGALAFGGLAWGAGPPYTVSVGGSSAAGSYTYTASSVGPVRLRFQNASSSNPVMTCTSLTLSGTVTSGAGVNPWGSVTSTTWAGCTFVGGAYTMTQTGAMSLLGTGSNATTGTETIEGKLGNVWLNGATTANPGICSFQVKGSTSSSTGSAFSLFNEPTQRLMVTESGFTGSLRVWSATGCLGQVQSGYPVDLEATFNVTTAGGAVNLS